MVLIQKLRRNLENLLRIVFIHEEYANLNGFVDGGELTQNINEKKKPDVLQAYRNVLGESVSLINMWNIVNQ